MIKKRELEAIILISIILLLIYTIYSYESKGIIYYSLNSDTSSLIQGLASLGDFAIIVFITIIIAEVIFAPFPPLILYLVGGILFGAFLGGIYALIGNIIGATMAFWIAKRYGRTYVEKKIPKNIIKKFDKFSSKYGAASIFLLRVNPFTTSDLFSYLAGLSKIKYWAFIIATSLGLLPFIFIQSYLGNVFNRNNTLFNLFLIVSLIYIVIFSIIIIIIKKNEK
ncbi:MAG: VTT domain-containing protein [archaeon]